MATGFLMPSSPETSEVSVAMDLFRLALLLSRATLVLFITQPSWEERSGREAEGGQGEGSGITNKAPGVTSKAPGVTNRAPDVTNRAPGVTNRAPGVTNKAPGVTNKSPYRVMRTLSSIDNRAWSPTSCRGDGWKVWGFKGQGKCGD